jgi:amino acid adenylation domain-containing protein
VTEPTDPRPEQLSRQDLDRLIRGLREQSGGAPAAARREIPEHSGGSVGPLSSAQERLWFLDRLEGTGAYHVAAVLELSGRLRLAALARAFAALVARHEPLRTRFRERSGEPVQEILPADDPAARPALPVVDLGGLPEPVLRAESERLARLVARHPFDLAEAPLLRLAALRSAAGRASLVVVLHHIVSDGWSLGITVRELGALYRAELEGGAPGMDELPVRYVDFAAWERARLTRGELDASLDFWRRRLEGLTPLALPTDRPRPERRSGRGRRLPVRLGAVTARRVEELARRRSATPFAVLLAAFQAWLGGVAGQDDVAVGTPVANRGRVETELLIGLFVNTLVMRADLGGQGSGRVAGPSFTELVERTAPAVMGALRHQELPLERVVAELAAGGSPAAPAPVLANPLFRVLFTLQNAPRERLELPGLELTAGLIDTRSAKLDLSLSLVPEGEALDGTLEYDADLFDRSTVRRLAGSFLAFLEAALAAPERPVRELPLSPADERRHALQFLGTGPPSRAAAGETVPVRIAARAAAVPDAVAVVGAAERLTYGELLRRADALARHVRWAGLGPESRIGLLLERSPAAVAALLGVLRAGAVAVPLDPESPPARLAAMAEDARLALLLISGGTSKGGAEGVPEEVPRLDPAPIFRAVDSTDAEPLPAPPEEAAAYVIFTSGSTGRPKGVVNSHRALANRLRWSLAGVGPEPSDAVLHKAPSSFDFSLWEVLAPLAAGARVVLAAPGRQGDPGHLRRRIARERVTVAHFVPPLLDLFVEAAEAAEADRGELAALRRVLSGGDALPPDLRDRACAVLAPVKSGPGATLCNQYGPTEAAIDVTLGATSPADGPGPVPIGPPGDGVRLAVADRSLRPMPIGVPGELLIAGAQVARGYEGRPAATAESFVPDPFIDGASGPGARLYRTGDRAVLRPDGRFAVLGRLDRQVKVRGYRIEPGEVEAALRSHPAVRDCVVDTADGEDRDALAAWVVPADAEDAPGAEALSRHLSDRLPPYLVPHAWALLPELPRTPSGKIDRRAVKRLTAGIAAGGDSAADDEPPRTATEAAVARVFARVLGAAGGADRSWGRRSDFFARGGHSLLAARAAAQLERALGREVPLRTLFEERTVAALAAALDRDAGETGPAGGARAVAEATVPARTEYPLSPAQRRLWFLYRYAPESPEYNMPGGLRVRGAFDPARAAAAIAAVAARHEALRTVFHEVDGEPFQRALPPRPVPLPVVDLSGLPADRRTESLEGIARTGARLPFDLSSGPVLRCRLVRLAADDHALLAEMHHIVSDGWSVEIFLRELGEIYRARAAGRTPELPELPVGYGALAARFRERLDAGLAEPDLDFWRRALDGAPTLELPTDHPRPPARRGAGATLSATLPPGTAGRLRRFAVEAEATPYSVLLAAWAALLGRYSGQQDLVVGTPVAGRDELDAEPVIGFFVQTLPVRIDLSGEPGFRELVRRAAGSLVSSLSHRRVPFEKLVEELAPQRDPSRTPFFQVVLGTALAPGSLDLADATAELVRVSTGTAKWDVVLSAQLENPGPDGSIHLEVELDTALFEPATVERMVRFLGRFLDAAVCAPETPVDDLPLLDGAERAELLAAARGIEPAYPRDSSLWSLVEEWALETPDAVALDEPTGLVTYGTLRRRSAGLARRLLVAGAGPADRVALVIAPSDRFVEALLGVLAASGVYVPLDPTQPEERLAVMLEDSGARVVLTDVSGAELTERLVARLPGEPPEVRFLDDAGPDVPGPEPETPLPPPPPAVATAHVMFTSGSTGRPKGVMVSHRSVARLVLESDMASTRPGDRVGRWGNGSFDASTWEIFCALLGGACLVGVERDVLLSPVRFGAELARRRVMSGLIPTAVFDQAAAELPTAFRTMDRLLFGGEAASAPSVRKVLETDPPGSLWNAYGPTECSVACTALRIDELSPDARSVSIGGPISHSTTHVVDRALRRVPPRVPGELVIGGDSVVVGYLNQPAVTAEAFVPDPWSPQPGARLYKSGDLVRWRSDGGLDFAGRFDDQVKIRGVRVEPGEVEEVLAGHPAVAQSVVVVTGGRPPRLVAYAVPDETALDGGAAPTPADLRAYLGERLPAALVPSALAVLEAMPLAAAGKVDRRALASEEWLARTETAPSERPETVPPRTPMEASVARVLGEVLDADTVGAHDDFFDLGGHSLLAHRVVSRLHRAHGVELPLRALFEDPTVAGLAARLEVAGASAEGPEGAAAGGIDGAGELRPRPGSTERRTAELSYSQERLWFLDRLDPGSARYNIPLGLRLRACEGISARSEGVIRASLARRGDAGVAGPTSRSRNAARGDSGATAVGSEIPSQAPPGGLSPRALAATLAALVRRHEALRTRFEEAEGEDGGPVQVIDPPPPPSLPVIDLSGLPQGAGRERELARVASRESERPFDLAAGPLLRACLLRLSRQDHVFVANLHHIVSDGWSSAVLVRELVALYPALAAGGRAEDVLPEPPVQYADFAAWQRRRLDGERLAAEAEHWRERLAGLPPLDLPADRPRPPTPTGRGGALPVAVPAGTADALGGLAVAAGTTRFAVLVAALEAMVLRSTGQSDFGIGAPVANRQRDETAGTVGFFVNTLVLRSDLRSDPDGRPPEATTFRQLVERVSGTLVEALDHQDLPFERLVEELAPERDPSRSPLFQVAIGLQPASAELSLPGLEVEALELGSGTSKFDWLLNLRRQGDGIIGTSEHDADLFDRATARRMVRRFLRLLSGAVAAPDTAVGELPVMDEAERRQLLVEWAGERTGYPRDATVPELFREVAAARPEAVAVADGGRALSYAELDRRSRRLAALLRERGVGPEVPVALLLERSADQVTATLAVLRAGGYSVPLEPGYPRERLVRTLAESKTPLLLSEGGLAETLSEGLTGSGSPWSGAVLRLEDALAAAEAAGAADDGAAGWRDAEVAPEGLCYVMYTSGSTGRPKGVAVPHRGVLRLVREPDFMSTGADETFLELAPTAFDASTLELWGALLDGGRLEVMPRGHLDLRELGRTLRERRVTSLWLTAGLFHQMVEERIQDLDDVRQLLAGGDVLSPPHVRALLARRDLRVPGARVIDGYGPTENTTFTTCHPMASLDDLPPGSPVPIGRPIADGRVVVLDAALRPVPLGVTGELCAAGDGLARGYLGWPSRTAESFVPHPEPREPGERLYRIGDLVRWRPDGTLEFQGRRDRQVKIRGFRIEPGEVELALRELPEVASGAVVVRGRGSDAARLVAWVVPADPEAGEALAATISRTLRETLPAAMVPEVVAVVDALPLDPNGKVDRKALTALDPADAGAAVSAGSTGGEREHVPPRTPAERLVAEVFEEVLGVGPIGAGDDFFDRGGHSLKATRVISRLRARSGVDLPVRALFEAPTVAGTAERLERLEGGPGTWLLTPRGSDGPAPLSFAQERLWILDRIEPGSSAYGIPIAVRLRGPLDHRAFERALAGVIERHDTLRTTFAIEAGRPVQIAHPPGPPPLAWVDLGGLPEARRGEALDRGLARASMRPFDLVRGPLLRAVMFLESPGEAVLQVTLHHVIADGWSLGVFVREMGALYRVATSGEPAGLDPLPLQYADFASGQRRWLTGAVRERQLAYWRERLDGAPPGLELPLDRPRPAVRGFRGGHRALRLPPALTAELRALARGERATLFMVLLAGFVVVLQRLAGEDDVVVGAPVAGRDRGEVEGLIGMFLNTLVLRTDLSGAPSFREVVARVRETVLGAFAHQDVPFEMLIDTLRPERDLSRTPFFQVYFNMLELQLESEIDFADVTAEVVRLPEMPAKFDLTLYVRPVDGGIDQAAVFNADLFDGETIERFLAQYRALLEQAVAEPARPVAALPLLVEEDRARLPDPARALAESWHGSVPEALVRAARETPDRIALAAPGASYSYRVLDAWSAAVAALLAAAGVERGDSVAIYTQRCPSLAAAVHGVLRAGAAFVNLDPSYPPARTADTVAAAGARVLLRLESAGPLHPELAERLAVQPGGVEVIDLPARPEAAALAAIDPAPPVPVGPDDAAYVAFTSGSTGRPKGIVGRHGPLTHFLPWQCRRFGLGPEDRFTLLSGLAHDPLQRDLFTPVWVGAALVLPEPEAMAVPERLRVWLAAVRATVAVLTPAMGQVLTERLAWGSGRAAGEAFLSRVFLVGDALTRHNVERLRRLAPGVTCINMYGSTETQRAVGYHEMPAVPAAGENGADRHPGGHPEGREVLPLGRGMEGAQLLVLAPGGGLAGIGEVGEIAVRSPHLSRGYRGEPALTAAKFVPVPVPPATPRSPSHPPRPAGLGVDRGKGTPPPDPLRPNGGDRMYRTGDLGRYDGAGEVRFLGRADQQVKVRGFRIELGEVTARVAGVAGVREAAVLLRTDGPLGPRLTAYAVPDDGAELAAADIREPLRSLLPPYMVPASYLFLDRLPLTPNRKLDRRALLALDDRTREDTVSRDAPTTEAEKQIAAVVQEVLGLEAVGPEENFFDLGGNSLLLIQVHGRLQEAFGREIPMVELFSHTTVRSLAAHLGAAGEGGEGPPPAEAPRTDRSEEVRQGRDRLRRRRRRRAAG